MSFDGEYNLSMLGQMMSKAVHIKTAVDIYEKYGEKRKNVLIFAVTILHAQLLAEAFKQKGYKADCVHSKMAANDRKEALDRYNKGESEFLVNVGILTEGWDCPKVDLIILCRPTMSPGLFVQMIGRGTRTYEGKKDLLILDLADNFMTHGDPSNPNVTFDNSEIGVSIPKEYPPAVKICPICHRVAKLSEMMCLDCGHMFKFESKSKIEAEIAPEMVKYVPGNPKKELLGLDVCHYVSKANNKMIKLTLVVKNCKNIYYYLSFESTNHKYMVNRSKYIWHYFAGYKSQPPNSNFEAISRKDELINTKVEIVTPYKDKNNFYKIMELN
jgi:DNA repair protein RadD